MRCQSLQMKFPALALIVCLSACGDNTGFQVSEQAALGQIGPVGATLDRARRDFIGEGGPLGGSLTAIPVDYSDGGSFVGTLAVVRSDDLTENLRLASKVYAEHSTLRARLPDGLSVFTDPMQARIWANGLGAEVSLGRSLTWPGGRHADLAAGLGLSRISASVHLQSALIDLRSTTLVTLPYAVLSARYAPVKGPDLQADIRAFSLDRVEVRLGLVQSW